MKTESCKYGHYYNLEKYEKCPYCDESQPMFEEDLSEETTIIDRTKTKELHQESLNSIDLEVMELAAWLVIISKKGKSQTYNITYGMNKIGRNKSNEISIMNGDTSISREKHSSIIYDFENNLFFIQHHDGKYLTYLNGTMVSSLTELKAYDKIKVGKTEFIFVPLCGELFKWDNDED